MLFQLRGVRVGVIQDDGVADADVLQRAALVIADGLTQRSKHLQTLAHLPRNTVH